MLTILFLYVTSLGVFQHLNLPSLREYIGTLQLQRAEMTLSSSREIAILISITFSVCGTRKKDLTAVLVKYDAVKVYILTVHVVHGVTGPIWS